MGTYRNSRKHGPFTYYHTNGKIREQGEYVADKKHKEWKEFDETGALKKTLLYRAGILISKPWHLRLSSPAPARMEERF